MTTIILISLAIFTTYVAVTAILSLKKDGKFPSSLSDTYYLIEEEWKTGFIFIILLLMILPFTMLPAMLDCTAEHIQFLPFLSCLSIAFVGAAPLFKSHQKVIHTVSAIFAAVMSVGWIILMHRWYCLAIVLALVVGAWLAVKSLRGKDIVRGSVTFWAEMVAFYGTYLTLLTI